MYTEFKLESLKRKTSLERLRSLSEDNIKINLEGIGSKDVEYIRGGVV
jgi:hypothetical protein